MAEPPWFIKHGLVVIGGRDLGLPRATVDQIIADVRRFHCDSALAVLLRLNLTLTHPHPLGQDELVRLWLPDVAERFLAAVRERRATEVFHEAQVLNLIRLVMLHAPSDTGRRCDNKGDFALLARLLLHLTDVLVERDNTAESDKRTWVFNTFTRTELFMHDEHFVPDVMARNYDLFVLVPRILNRRGPDSYDLHGMFVQVTGLEVQDYLALGFGLLTHYDTIPSNTLGDAPIGIDRQRHFADVLIPAEVRDRIWPLVSKPLDEYRAELEAEWSRTAGLSRWSAMRTFTQFPMIQLPDGPVVAVSRRLLRDRITHGIYWILANGVANRQEFTNFFGHVFEAYVCRSLIRGAGGGFRWGVEYDGADEGKRPEGALVMPRSVALIEAKARRLLLNVREIGGEAELRDAVRDGLDEAAEQIATAIEAGRRGALAGIPTADDTKYYPVIVTYEPLPSHPLAQKIYEDIIYKGGRLRAGAAKPVTMLDTRDIESLEGLIWNGTTWPDLLSRKHTPPHVEDSFHNYLYRTLGGEFPRNEYLARRWERIGDMIGHRLFGASLEHPPRRPQRRRRRPRRWR